MKIKNTRELVLRAQAHARADHILQSTYGEGSVNGDEEYQGCAIGCLSTPHRRTELRAFLRQYLGEWRAWSGKKDITLTSYQMTARLGEEFGICPELARAAEDVFERLDTHGAAIEWIPAFAKALVEGSSVTPAMMRAWAKRIEGPIGITINEVTCDAVSFAEGDLKDRAELVGLNLLDWLSGLKPRA